MVQEYRYLLILIYEQNVVIIRADLGIVDGCRSTFTLRTVYFSTFVCCFAYNFPILISSSSCAALLTAFLPWFLLLPRVLRCLQLSYPDFFFLCAALLTAFLPWFLLLPHVLRCLQFSCPDFFFRCAALLTTFLLWFLLLHELRCLQLSYPDYSSRVCSFALSLSYHDFSFLICCFSYYFPTLIFLSALVGSLAYYFPTLISPSSCAALYLLRKTRSYILIVKGYAS